MEINDLDEILGTIPKPVECPAPGIYYDMPAVEYHAIPAVSSTLIKSFAKRPSTAQIPYIAKDDANVGSGLHAYCLQGEEALNRECIFGPSFGKSQKDLIAKAVLAAENPTKTVLPPAPGWPIMDILKGVNTSLQEHPKVGSVIRDSQKEVSLIWEDEASECMCKARLDVWDGRIIWDLKKTRGIDKLRYEMDGGLRYRLQAGHYLNGAIACGLDPVAFGFIACEAVPPYEIRPFYSDPEKTEAAQAEVIRLIGLIKESVVKCFWPNFPPPPNIFTWDELTPDDTMEII